MKVTATIIAENTWTGVLDVAAGFFSLSIKGTFVATVTVQRTYDGTNWGDVGTFTGQTEQTGQEGSGAKYRAGVKTGDFTSGTIEILLME